MFRNSAGLPILDAGENVNNESSSKTGSELTQECRPKLLLVEDVAMIRKLLCSVLSHANYEVMEATNGEEAMHILATSVPDLILSDIQMPVMDGIQLLTNVRANHASKDIPFVVLSADFDVSLENQLRDLGATKLINKLGPHSVLLDAIRELLTQNVP